MTYTDVGNARSRLSTLQLSSHASLHGVIEMLHQKKLFNSLCYLTLMLLSGSALLAANVTLMVDPAEVSLNETFQLIYTVQGEQSGEPDFSPLKQDFQLLGTSSSSQISMINGSTTQSKSYTLRMAPKRVGELIIPSISFAADQSNPGRILVSEKPVATATESPGIENNLRLTASVDVAQPYVQQQVLLTLKIYRRVKWQQAALSELDPAGSNLLVQRLGEDKHSRATLDGLQWEVIERKYAVFPQQSGELEISPFTLTVALPDQQKQRRRSNDPFDRFFSRQPSVQKVVRSDAIRLQVRPVVDGVMPWLVAKDLKLQENWSLDTHKLKAGESVTRTIAIIADGVSLGQLPPLEPAAVAGIKRYPDQPQTNEQTTGHGLLSTSSRKFALIPSRAGKFEIPPLEVKWWNVNTDKLETARLPGRTLEVSGEIAAAVTATPDAPVLTVQPKLTDSKSAGKPVAPDSAANRWLILSNAVLLIILLITLYAWRQDRKTRQQIPVQPDPDEATPGRRALLRQLEGAISRQDTEATRDILLKLAQLIWPDTSPSSLAQLSRLTTGVLSDELLNLERSLYAVGQTQWDGELVLREVSLLKPKKHNDHPKQQALKPMYPLS